MMKIIFMNTLSLKKARVSAMRHIEKMLRFIFGSHCGMSATAIICRMNDIEGFRTDHPHDPSDFGRCIKLLDEFPEFRVELHCMKDVSIEWELLIDNWQDLEAMFYAGHNKELYARMKELFNSIPCEECKQPLNRSYVHIDGKRYHRDCLKNGTKIDGGKSSIYLTY